ncbi:hypothetical protein ACFQVA_36385 [Actinomadura keratinilytica]
MVTTLLRPPRLRRIRSGLLSARPSRLLVEEVGVALHDRLNPSVGPGNVAEADPELSARDLVERSAPVLQRPAEPDQRHTRRRVGPRLPDQQGDPVQPALGVVPQLGEGQEVVGVPHPAQFVGQRRGLGERALLKGERVVEQPGVLQLAVEVPELDVRPETVGQQATVQWFAGFQETRPQIVDEYARQFHGGMPGLREAAQMVTEAEGVVEPTQAEPDARQQGCALRAAAATESSSACCTASPPPGSPARTRDTSALRR